MASFSAIIAEFKGHFNRLRARRTGMTSPASHMDAASSNNQSANLALKSDVTFSSWVPRQDSEAILLVLTARPNLNPGMEDLIRTHAQRITDWQTFAVTAAKKFSISYAYRHLKSHASDIVPIEDMNTMSQLARRSAMATLRVVAAHIEFHKSCIVPTNATYAYLKGAALCVQSNRETSDRFCRDIDILVAEKDFGRVIRRAISSGYRLLLSAEPLDFAETTRDIDFAIRYETVVMLMGPNNVLVEVHRRLGKISLSFDLKRAFKESEEISISGVPMQTLSKPLHFVYACYHHGRHFWSRLHWLADLSAMVHADEFEQKKIEQLAAELGILPTVQASYEFEHLSSSPDNWPKALSKLEGGGQFLKACLVNLEGGLELEKRIRDRREMGEFMSSWQFDGSRKKSLRRNTWIHRMRPSVPQYQRVRLPLALQWIYYVENLYKLTQNAILRALGQTPGATIPSPENNKPNSSTSKNE